MAISISEIKTALEAQNTKTDALIALLQDVRNRLDEAVANGGADQAALQDLSDSIASQTAEIDAAVEAAQPTV